MPLFFRKEGNSWVYYINGKVSTASTDIVNGTINGNNGWWYIKKGKADFGYTGVTNINGWWDVKNSKVIGETVKTVPEKQVPVSSTYILNTNSKKFHYSTCSAIKNTKEKNKKVYDGTRDDIIGMGYEPCSLCHP